MRAKQGDERTRAKVASPNKAEPNRRFLCAAPRLYLPFSNLPISSPNTSYPQPYQADRLLRELLRRPSPAAAADADSGEAAWLRARLAALAAALGGGGRGSRGGDDGGGDDAAAAAAKAAAKAAAALAAEAAYNGGAELLDADADAFAAPLAALRAALALDAAAAAALAAREPRLLLRPELAAAAKRVVTRLTALYPYKSPNKKQDVVALVIEYPELLVRMPVYVDDKAVKKVEDLPVDLQNRISRSYC